MTVARFKTECMRCHYPIMVGDQIKPGKRPGQTLPCGWKHFDCSRRTPAPPGTMEIDPLYVDRKINSDASRKRRAASEDFWAKVAREADQKRQGGPRR